MALSDNKRIAKNTMYLYVRQLITMAVSLYTFRMLLRLLGVNDYGTYNVIGGVVILFSFISGAMTQATQRYLSYHIGRDDREGLKRVFAMSVNIYMLVCALIVVLSETVGLWFVNNCLEFPCGDMFAVNVVYQCTIATLVIQVMQLPYQAAIVSFERMNFFAYVSIVEVAMKLLVVLVLFLAPSGRLIWYGVLLTLVALVICLAFRYYCNRRFEDCRYCRYWDRQLFKDMTSFGGWNLLGSAGNVITQQGINILFNIFIGVAVNAAMGVSNQVCGAVNKFVQNFQTAFNPQIIKLYAAEKREEFFALIFRSSRISYGLLFVLGLPIIVCCRPILTLWLTTIPEYTVEFIQIMIGFCLVDALSGPLWVSAQATGRIRNYMLIISTLTFVNLPTAYLILWLHLSPVYVILSRAILQFVIANVRVIYLRGLLGLPVGEYYRSVMLPVVLATVVALPLPLYLATVSSGLIWQGVLLVFTAVVAMTSTWIILLTRGERVKVIGKLKSMLGRR